MDVTVVVGTYGDPSWPALAASRAVPSAQALGVPVVHVHADTLHDARNQGLAQVTTEWVVHLDADDELEPGYMDAVAAGRGDVRAPSVRYVTAAGHRPPAVMPRVAGHAHTCTQTCLTQGNWLVVGAAARTSLLRDVGGWRDWPVYEDWDLWLRCHLAGAAVDAVPQAVYRAYVRRGSRNRAPSIAVKNAAHRAIEEANGLGAVSA